MNTGVCITDYSMDNGYVSPISPLRDNTEYNTGLHGEI